jgi:hypothetical protein
MVAVAMADGSAAAAAGDCADALPQPQPLRAAAMAGGIAVGTAPGRLAAALPGAWPGNIEG